MCMTSVSSPSDEGLVMITTRMTGLWSRAVAALAMLVVMGGWAAGGWVDLAGAWVRPLTADEAAATRVGERYCHQKCADKTADCPTATVDYCARAEYQRQPKCRGAGNEVAPFCYKCEKTAKYKICETERTKFCTPHAADPSPCGGVKQVACDWNGTKCVCPALPPAWDAEAGCPESDCGP